MGRARDLANILSSSGSVALDSELALVQITPTSITATGGSGSISTTGAVSFTSASAISLNGCFTSTYDNYKLICEVTSASANADMQGRYRLNGSDATASSYSSQYNVSYSTTVAGGTNNTTIMDFGSISTNTRYVTTIEFFRPFTTGQHLAISNQFYLTSASAWAIRINGHRYDVATAYDGFSLIASTGTITGTLRMYGYRN